MTTKISIVAEAGCPVIVKAIDRFESSVKETVLGVLVPGAAYDFYATDNREIRVIEARLADGVVTHKGAPLDFSDVVRGLKAGKRFARSGWNGKGMFIFLVAGSRFKVSREPLLSILGEGTEVDYHGHVDMRTATGQIVPWVCSQTDMLAEDWCEV